MLIDNWTFKNNPNVNKNFCIFGILLNFNFSAIFIKIRYGIFNSFEFWTNTSITIILNWENIAIICFTDKAECAFLFYLENEQD